MSKPATKPDLIAGKDPDLVDYFPMYPEAFFVGCKKRGYLGDMMGTYALLLFMIYASPRGRLADDDHVIWRFLECKSIHAWRKVKARLVHDDKIQLIDGFIRNRKADDFFEKKLPVINDARRNIEEKASKKTGKKTPEKSPSFSPPQQQQGLGLDDPLEKRPYARGRESESEVEREKTTSTSMPSDVQVITQVALIATTLGQPRGQYWERDYRRMIEDGLTPDDILEAAKGHRGDPIRSLNALKGLANTKRKQREERDPPPRPVAQAPKHSTKVWEGELTKLLAWGGWDAFNYGPPPTREGHHVPPELHAGWHKLWVMQGSHPVEEFDYSGNKVPYPADWPSEMARSFWEPDK